MDLPLPPVARSNDPTLLASGALPRRSLLLHGVALASGAVALACEHGPVACNDVSQLSAEQKNTRSLLGYVDASSEPGKSCAQCDQYVAPPKSDQCGTCKVLAGTVHPRGYCRAFTPKG